VIQFISAFGTKLPIRNVRNSIAIRGKSDIARTPNSVESDPKRAWAAQTAFAAKLSHSPNLVPLRQSGYGMFTEISN
jgi:hypothetical protein